MKTPDSRTPTLVRTAPGAALRTAGGDAPAVMDTDAASGGPRTVLGHADSAWLLVGPSRGDHDFAVQVSRR